MTYLDWQTLKSGDYNGNRYTQPMTRWFFISQTWSTKTHPVYCTRCLALLGTTSETLMSKRLHALILSSHWYCVAE